MAKDTIPLLLDTDIGSDIDDAVCLSYLLRQPRCELLGITTVSGQPESRASLADAICRAAGRTDIPIHSGCDSRLVTGEIVQPACPQAEILPRFEHRPPKEFAPNTAVGFLREQIHARPGEITLLGIGPMMNIALLFATDPETIKKLRRIVVMCGVFTNRLAGVGSLEWNALCDPHATAVLYRARVADHLSIGLDVTMKCQIPADECVQRFRDIGGPLSVVAAATEIWKTHAATVTFHDPLAAATIYRPDLCTMSRGTVTVELDSRRLAGMTHFDAGGDDAPHRIAVEVDPKRFFAEYFAVTGG
jgi:purine nucleosidase